MSQDLHAFEVFTPNGFPAWTYVERKQDFERQVLNGIRTPNIIVSISGPSKSGKSVLLQKVVGEHSLIRVFGPQIQIADDVWRAVFDALDAPTTSTLETGTTNTTASTIGGQAGLNFPGGILSVGGKADSSNGSAVNSKHITVRSRMGLPQLARQIKNTDYVVFIDDFHYMPRELQGEVAKQLKAAAELGIKICTASVPHRSDDVVRANPELRGRVQAVDMDYWTVSELEEIGRAGFPRLNMSVGNEFISRLAVEACGSPQLMQSLCLQTCFRLNVDRAHVTEKAYSLGDPDLRGIAEATSTMADFSTVVEAMHAGPKLRGQERKEYQFHDGTKGDVHRSVLLAIAADPPTMSIPYAELMTRVLGVCKDSSPVGSSVSEACSQIDKIAAKSVEATSEPQGIAPIEWDTSAAVENLHIAEPYFLFYLRSAPKLKQLGMT